jgi:hypothetical protein
MVVSGTGYLTVREHGEYTKHVEDKFTSTQLMIARQEEDLKGNIADLSARLSSMEGKLDVALRKRQQ